MLIQKLQDDLKEHLRSRNQEAVDALRVLLAEVKNAEIEKRSELDDADIQQIIKKEVKKLKDALAMFETAQRADLAEQNRKHIEILSVYLPAELGDDDLAAQIDKLIADNQAVLAQNPKALMGIVMKALSSQADPQRIMAVLRSKESSV